MGKSFSIQSAVILFWLFLFITIKFCCANSPSSATHQAFPENEGKPKNGNLGNRVSINHIEEAKFISIKKPFNENPLQLKPVILKKSFIKVLPRISDIQRISSNSSIPIFEEKPSIQMVKRPNFLLIPFLRNLFPIMKRSEHILILKFKRPTLKPIPYVKSSKFLPIPRFRRLITKTISIVKKPIPEYKKSILEPISKFEKLVSEPYPPVEKPIPKYEKPTLEPISPIIKPIPKLEKPISEPIPIVQKSIPAFEKPISEPFPPEPMPAVEIPVPKDDKPILEPISVAKKPIPKFEKPISEPIPAIEKSILKDEKPISKSIPLIKKSISNNEKPLPMSKKDLLLPQLATTTDPESLKLKESLFKKAIPKIPFPPKFKKPLLAQKPIPPP